MSSEEFERRYVRKPKPESKVSLGGRRRYNAYRDGQFLGEVRLTHDSKRRYEERGITFKAVYG